MATFNTQTTYNRTYEKKVIEENPRVVRSGSPFSTQTVLQNLPSIPSIPLPSGFPSFQSFVPSYSSHQSTSSRTVATNVGTLQQSDDSIHLSINVSEYKTEELKVSVIGDFIVIEAKHGERSDELGTIERQFTRKIALPKGCPPESVISSLSSDGILSISAVAPRKEASPARSIPIKVVATPSAQTSPAPPQQQSSQPSPNPQV
ncbi:unnamed protein product, partial [Mesorhabditis belari]|uniref:SHSP domain-containing protein n=1 Tax=Mesorhabditis belari TaxID=2138241 RepID=A0AAF3F0C5_9BILA